MEQKFMAATDQVMHRMNELGQRIDTLESNLSEIVSALPTDAPEPSLPTENKKS